MGTRTIKEPSFLEITNATRTISIRLFCSSGKSISPLSLCLLIVAECFSVLGKPKYSLLHLQSLNYTDLPA